MTNPYESPQTTEPRGPDLPEFISNRDKFLLLGGALFAGLLTFFPWPALLFIAFSTPLFYHAFRIERLRRRADRPPDWKEQAALALSSTGVTIAMIAATLGAFFGTCNIGAWATVGILSGFAKEPAGAIQLIGYAVVAGPIVGLVGGGIAAWFLLHWKDATLRRTDSDKEV